MDFSYRGSSDFGLLLSEGLKYESIKSSVCENFKETLE